ncbi:MAG TPA: DUF2845 domain-containing protein [Geobacteraceae bacterium]|nr:DUF2845 domain-containing protein [Geobacteraceae bacterium]
MKTVVCLLFAVLFSLQLPVTVDALQTGTMRCRNGIVSINDTIPDVVKKCGSPAFQDRREETHSYGQRHSRSYETVTIDSWTYNFGPQEFMYEVTFQNGRVAKIESLDAGY